MDYSSMEADQLAVEGFATVQGVLAGGECGAIAAMAATASAGSVGTRSLLPLAWCQNLVKRLRQHPIIAAVVPAEHVAAQCTYFEKSISRNWLVPIHQDLSIPVSTYVPSSQLQGWSEKEGALFVQPPVGVLQNLIAVRLHLDPCGQSDGPLQVVPRTHERGRIDSEAAVRCRRTGPVVTCTLDQGDALVMRPLLLHASSKATGTSMRRVLHFLFGPRSLPYGLQWQHAV